jgi:hypothetical protein
MLIILLVGLAGVIAMLGQTGSHPPSPAQRNQALLSLSTAAPDVHWDSRSLVAGDITCNGLIEQVYIGHTADRIYVGLFRAANKSPEILEFRLGGGYQDAVCDPMAAKLETYSLDHDQDHDLKGLRRSRTCKGLSLEDNSCDPINLYWNRTTQHLTWWRN